MAKRIRTPKPHQIRRLGAAGGTGIALEEILATVKDEAIAAIEGSQNDSGRVAILPQNDRSIQKYA